MPRESVHVRNTLGLASSCCCPAYTSAKWNTHAGGLALVGAKYQLVATQNVNAEPVYVPNRVVQQTDEIARIGERILLVAD